MSQDTNEDLQLAGTNAIAAYHDEGDWDEDPVLETETSVRLRPHTIDFSGLQWGRMRRLLRRRNHSPG